MSVLRRTTRPVTVAVATSAIQPCLDSRARHGARSVTPPGRTAKYPVVQISAPSDEELLSATDARSFEFFYRRHVDTLLGYFARRTGNAEMAADLTSETFAAALAGR